MKKHILLFFQKEPKVFICADKLDPCQFEAVSTRVPASEFSPDPSVAAGEVAEFFRGSSTELPDGRSLSWSSGDLAGIPTPRGSLFVVLGADKAYEEQHVRTYSPGRYAVQPAQDGSSVIPIGEPRVFQSGVTPNLSGSWTMSR